MMGIVIDVQHPGTMLLPYPCDGDREVAPSPVDSLLVAIAGCSGIDVVEIPGKPGAFRAVAFLRPHFQLDELSVSMRLVADLPPPAQ